MCSTDVSTDEEGGERPELSTRDKAELMEAMQQGQLAGMEKELPQKGLFAMPFMRRALAKQREAVALEAGDILAAQELVGALPAGEEDPGSTQSHSGRIVMPGPTAAGRRGGRAELQPVVEEEGGEEEDVAARAARMHEAAAAQLRTAAGSDAAPRRAVVKSAAAGKVSKGGAPEAGSRVTVAGRAGAVRPQAADQVSVCSAACLCGAWNVCLFHSVRVPAGCACLALCAMCSFAPGHVIDTA